MQILMGFPLALDLRDIIDVSMIQPPPQPEPEANPRPPPPVNRTEKNQ